MENRLIYQQAKGEAVTLHNALDREETKHGESFDGSEQAKKLEDASQALDANWKKLAKRLEGQPLGTVKAELGKEHDELKAALKASDLNPALHTNVLRDFFNRSVALIAQWINTNKPDQKEKAGDSFQTQVEDMAYRYLGYGDARPYRGATLPNNGQHGPQFNDKTYGNNGKHGPQFNDATLPNNGKHGPGYVEPTEPEEPTAPAAETAPAQPTRAPKTAYDAGTNEGGEMKPERKKNQREIFMNGNDLSPEGERLLKGLNPVPKGNVIAQNLERTRVTNNRHRIGLPYEIAQNIDHVITRKELIDHLSRQ